MPRGIRNSSGSKKKTPNRNKTPPPANEEPRTPVNRRSLRSTKATPSTSAARSTPSARSLRKRSLISPEVEEESKESSPQPSSSRQASSSYGPSSKRRRVSVPSPAVITPSSSLSTTKATPISGRKRRGTQREPPSPSSRTPASKRAKVVPRGELLPK